MKFWLKIPVFLLLLAFPFFISPALGAEKDSSPKSTTKKSDQSVEDRVDELEKELQKLKSKVEVGSKDLWDPYSWLNKFELGGYGELHANFVEGSDDNIFDIHRFVLIIGYEFNDWIKFESELEVEHAFVSDGNGDLVFEQLFVDFEFTEALGLRVGRVLTPVGIINQRHEPPSFYGVERPLFSKVIIPSTWSADGVGIFGHPSSSLSYELYAVAGLDGSQFSPTNGIRGGRIKERPTLHEPAITGRVDFVPPFIKYLGQALRVGASFYYGGLDNGNKTKSGVEASLQIYSADFSYTIGRFDLRGVIAYQFIDGASNIGGNVANEILGGYIEVGFRFLPDSMKKGILKKAEMAIFARYSKVDTQKDMPSGVTRNGAGNRDIYTVGLSFYPTTNVVFKTDAQYIEDKTNADLPILYNFGLGWQF